MNIVFFGTTSDSVFVLETLCHVSSVMCQAVVTQPPRPIGRKQIITPTPIEVWAKEHKIPVLSFAHNHKKPWLFENEQTVIDALQPFKADLIISACFGQKIPIEIIRAAKYSGLNVHPSLLPRWRGADPVPWAILSGDHQTGVTIVTLEEAFDKGIIIAQQKYPITDTDTSDPLRTKLFQMGAELLINNVDNYCSRKNKGKLQKTSDTPYARRMTREDGFVPWKKFQPELLDQKFRALSPWPGLWTLFGKKRLKLIALKPEILVQLEGKKPVTFEQFQKAYLPS